MSHHPPSPPNEDIQTTVSDSSAPSVKNVLKNIQHPELFCGLVAPIGVDTQKIVHFITNSLDSVGYKATPVKLTQLMKEVATTVQLADSPPEIRYDTHIKYANEVRELFESDDPSDVDGDAALAMLAVSKIRSLRKVETEDEMRPDEKRAYIIDQFKRPEEIKLFRRIYGRLFVLFSVHASAKKRKQIL